MIGDVKTGIIVVLLSVLSVRAQLFQGGNGNGNGHAAPDLEAIAENMFREGAIVPTTALAGNDAMQDLQLRMRIMNLLRGNANGNGNGNFNHAATAPTLLAQYSNFMGRGGEGTGGGENGGALFGEQGIPAIAFAAALTSTSAPFGGNVFNRPQSRDLGAQAFQTSVTTARLRDVHANKPSPSKSKLFKQFQSFLIEKLETMSRSSPTMANTSEIPVVNHGNLNGIQRERTPDQHLNRPKNTHQVNKYNMNNAHNIPKTLPTLTANNVTRRPVTTVTQSQVTMQHKPPIVNTIASSSKSKEPLIERSGIKAASIRRMFNTNVSSRSLKAPNKGMTSESGILSRSTEIQKETFRKPPRVPAQQALARDNILASAFKLKPKRKNVSREPELSTIRNVNSNANEFDFNNATYFQQRSNEPSLPPGQSHTQKGTYDKTQSNDGVVASSLLEGQSGHPQSNFRRGWKPPSRNSPAYKLLSKIHKSYQSPASSNNSAKPEDIDKPGIKSAYTAATKLKQTVVKQMIQNGQYQISPTSPRMHNMARKNSAGTLPDGDPSSQVYQYILTVRLPNESQTASIKFPQKSTTISTTTSSNSGVNMSTMHTANVNRADEYSGKEAYATESSGYVGQNATDVNQYKSANINHKQNTRYGNNFDRSNRINNNPFPTNPDNNNRHFGAGRLSEYDVNGGANYESSMKKDMAVSSRYLRKSSLNNETSKQNYPSIQGISDNRVNKMPIRPSQKQVLDKISNVDYIKYEFLTTTTEGSKYMQNKLNRPNTTPKKNKRKSQTTRSKYHMPLRSAKRFGNARIQKQNLTIDKYGDNTGQQVNKRQRPSHKKDITPHSKIDIMEMNMKAVNGDVGRFGMDTITKSQNMQHQLPSGTSDTAMAGGTGTLISKSQTMQHQSPSGTSDTAKAGGTGTLISKSDKSYAGDKAKRLQYLKRIRNMVDKELNSLATNNSSDTSNTKSESNGVVADTGVPKTIETFTNQDQTDYMYRPTEQRTRNSQPTNTVSGYSGSLKMVIDRLRSHSRKIKNNTPKNIDGHLFNRKNSALLTEGSQRQRQNSASDTVTSGTVKSTSIGNIPASPNTVTSTQNVNTNPQHGTIDNTYPYRNTVIANTGMTTSEVSRKSGREQANQSTGDQKTSLMTGVSESSLNIASLNELIVNTMMPGTSQRQDQNQRLGMIMASLTASFPDRAAAAPGGKCNLSPICGHDGVTYFSECLLPPAVIKTCDGYCPCSLPNPAPRKVSEQGLQQDATNQAKEQENVAVTSNIPMLQPATTSRAYRQFKSQQLVKSAKHISKGNANGQSAQYITTPKAEPSTKAKETTIFQTSKGGYASDYKPSPTAISNTELKSQGIDTVKYQAGGHKDNIQIVPTVAKPDTYHTSAKSPGTATTTNGKSNTMHTTVRQEANGAGTPLKHQPVDAKRQLKPQGVGAKAKSASKHLDATQIPSPQRNDNSRQKMPTAVENITLLKGAPTIESIHSADLTSYDNGNGGTNVKQMPPEAGHGSSKRGIGGSVQSTITATDVSGDQPNQQLVSKAIAALKLLRDLRANGFQVLPERGNTANKQKHMTQREHTNAQQGSASATAANGHEASQGVNTNGHTASLMHASNGVAASSGTATGTLGNSAAPRRDVNGNNAPSGVKLAVPKARVTLLSICVKRCQMFVYDPVCSAAGNSFTNNCYLLCSGERRMCNGTCPCDFDNLPPRQREKLATSYSLRAQAMNMDPLELAEVTWFKQRCACILTDKLHVCTDMGQTSTRCMAQCNSEPIRCRGKCPCQ